MNISAALSESIRNFWRHGKIILLFVIIGKSFSLAWKLVLARLGPDALGTVEISLAIFYSLQAFSLLGFQTALMRFTTVLMHTKRAAQGTGYLFLSLKITALLGIIYWGLFTLYPELLIQFFNNATTLADSLITYLWVVPLLTASELLWSFWAAAGHMPLYAFGKYVLPPICRVATLAVLLYYGLNHQALVPHLIIAIILALTISAILSRRIVTTSEFSLRAQDTRQFIRYVFPMSGSFLLFAIYAASSIMLTGKFLGITSVGLLSAAIVFIDIPDMVLIPMLNIFQVHLGPFIKKPARGMLFAAKNSLAFLVIGSLIGLSVYIILPWIIPALLGQQFSVIVVLVGWLLVAKVIESSIILPLRHVLDFYGFTKTTFVLMMIATITQILVGVTLIPQRGLNGIIAMQWTSVGVHLVGTLIACWIHLYPSARQDAKK